MAKWAEKPVGATVTISAAEYQGLRDAQFKLQCLENGGVDNWEWYGESLSDYHDMLEEREGMDDGA